MAATGGQAATQDAMLHRSPLETVSALFGPGQLDTPAATVPVSKAVLVGELHYFNHFDGKWVFYIKTGQLHHWEQCRPVQDIKVVLLGPSSQRSSGRVGTYRVLAGPPGTYPYVLTPEPTGRAPAAPTNVRVPDPSNGAEAYPQAKGGLVGHFHTATCKKRKYRVSATKAALWTDGVWYVINELYCEFTFQQ